MMKKNWTLYVSSFISGLVLVPAFSPYDFWPLAFFALVPFLASLYGAISGREAFKAGLVMGIPFFFGTQYWIYNSIHMYGGLNPVLSICVVLLLSFYQSLYTAIFAMLYHRGISNTERPSMLVAPVLWVLLEYLKTYIITGFPWSSIGYSQYLFTSFIQFADLTGIYGVSFMVVLINAAFADIFIMTYRRRKMPLVNLTPTVLGYMVVIILCAFVLNYGNYRLDQPRPGERIRVSLIQGNIEQDIKWNPEYQDMVLNTYEQLTRNVSELSPDLIIWPESALPFYLGRDQKNTERFLSFQRSIDIPLLTGSVLVNRKDDGNHTLSNSAVLITNSPDPISYRFDKIHLVPFGEYVPLKGFLFFINRMVTGIGDFEQGKHFIRGQVGKNEFGTAICYEIIFPGLIRHHFKDGGSFIINITNDAWFGNSPGPYQHFAMSVFRAVENRKPVIRAANTGISGFIDSSGRIYDSSSLFKTTTMTHTIQTDRTRTFYTRFGDLVPYFCIIISIFIFANPRRS